MKTASHGMSLEAATHVGTFIRSDLLVPYGLTERTLAKRLGVPVDRLHAVIAGRAHLTPEFAARLGRLSRAGAEYWAGLDGTVDVAAAMAKFPDLDAVVPLEDSDAKPEYRPETRKFSLGHVEKRRDDTRRDEDPSQPKKIFHKVPLPAE